MPEAGSYYPSQIELVKLAEIFNEDPDARRMYEAFNKEVIPPVDRSFGGNTSMLNQPRLKFYAWYRAKKQKEEADAQYRENQKIAHEYGLRTAYQNKGTK
jgi:uncharacterized SAM-dependent methyltransferase